MRESGDKPIINEVRLPGEEMIRKGLLDLSNNQITKEALLVSIGEPRLKRLGYVVPPYNLSATPEHTLFQLCIQEEPGHAHSAYNALIRRLTSFEHAAAWRQRKDLRDAAM